MFFSFLIGIFLGFIFFGGLYYTTSKLGTFKYPTLIMFVSFIIRIIILISGLFYIYSGYPSRLFIGILGVFITKYVVIHFVKKGVS